VSKANEEKEGIEPSLSKRSGEEKEGIKNITTPL